MIAPGPIDGTEGVDRLSAKGPDAPQYSWQSPLGRNGHIKEVANAAVFLFSPAARYITGQIIDVDGGCEHLRTLQLPYPQAVLDPDSVQHLIKPRL